MQMLETDILPCFERMKREKEQYLEWQQACSNAEQLGHIVSAYRYWKLENLLEEEKELHKSRRQELEGLQADHEAYVVC
jgi:Mn-dependent DtxR family transcriptional regulator